MAAGHEPTLQDLSREYNLVPELLWIIEPDHNPRGGITLYNPCERYPNRGGLCLHEWGEGPFCRFKIPVRFRNRAGVYLLVVDGKIRFAGWSRNLVQRMNQNYGTISPRKCFEGSEPENCMVNHQILLECQKRKNVMIYLIQDGDSDLCDAIIRQFSPAWNRFQ